MIVLCKNCEPPYTVICDFCWFYCFNGRWVWLEESWQQVYTEDGFCWLDMLPRDPIENCDNFRCRFKMMKYWEKE